MAVRVVNGNTFTEDGWPLVDEAGCTWITVAGTNPPVRIQVQSGLPATVLGAWEADWNANIEPLEDPTTACWTEGNSVLGQPGKNNGSNHLGGTAVDSCWERHPMGPEAPDPAAGFSQAQYDEMQRMKAYYTFTAKDGTVIQVVWWANDWDTPHDSMHSQMGYGTYKYRDEVAAWAAQHIRTDGFSTYRRGAAPNDDTAAELLANVMGGTVPFTRYQTLMPAVAQCLQDCGCTTINRIAMWLAQVGHESVGLKYMSEIWGPTAAQLTYQGRMGNVNPGDGYRYRGRGPIQVTGHDNYAELSQWAFGQSLVPSPTFFVDDPDQLASDTYGFVGVTWYWTTQRPMNQLSDNGDIVGATKAVNGGTTGLDDRTARWNSCRALGDQLLTLTTGDDDMFTDDDRDLLKQISGYRRPSLSPLRHLGEGDVNTCAGFAWSADANIHVVLVERLAVTYGDPTCIALLMEVAAADPTTFPDRQTDAALAKAILAKVPKTGVTAANKQIKAWLDAETAAK